MTEKVVSLSGGLVLGMVVALFLGIGATQSIAPSLHFEIPSILQMTIAQNTHNTPAPTNDTTPTAAVATPADPDRGRITRIATLTETTDPVFGTTASTSEAAPKDWDVATTPKVNSALQRTNLQHTYIASNSQASNSAYAGLGQAAARQGNFTALIDNAHGGYTSSSRPAVAQNKPQTQGSPAVAHNDPGTGVSGDEGPAVTHDKTPTPSEDNNNGSSERFEVSHGRPHHNFTPDQDGPSLGDGDTPGRPGPSQMDGGRQGWTQ